MEKPIGCKNVLCGVCARATSMGGVSPPPRHPEVAPVSVPTQFPVALALNSGLFDAVLPDKMAGAEHAVQLAATNLPAGACAQLETTDALNDKDRVIIIKVARQPVIRFRFEPESQRGFEDEDTTETGEPF